jgi:PIN domain nuclease of toxin-antitoxin system
VRLLVDTHVWLWMLGDPDRLSPEAREVLGDTDNEVLVSAASAWEIGIKHALGRLPLPEDPVTYVPARITASGCTPLAIEQHHALAAAALPPHHRDPFDRLLVAQAAALDVPLVTADRALHPYAVTRIDA